MNSPTRGLCVWDFWLSVGEVIFYFRFPLRSGLYTGCKPQLDPAFFRGPLPTPPGATPLPCRLAMRDCCYSRREASWCLLHRPLLCGMEGVHMLCFSSVFNPALSSNPHPSN